MVRFVDISLSRLKVAIGLCSAAAVDSSDIRAIKFQIELRKQILNDMEAVHRRLRRLRLLPRDVPLPRKVQGRSTSARVISPKNSQTARSRVATGFEKTC